MPNILPKYPLSYRTSWQLAIIIELEAPIRNCRQQDLSQKCQLSILVDYKNDGNIQLSKNASARKLTGKQTIFKFRISELILLNKYLNAMYMQYKTALSCCHFVIPLAQILRLQFCLPNSSSPQSTSSGILVYLTALLLHTLVESQSSDDECITWNTSVSGTFQQILWQ